MMYTHTYTDVGLDCVSGWRLLDALPYWAPKIGQEMKKVRTYINVRSFLCATLIIADLKLSV